MRPGKKSGTVVNFFSIRENIAKTVDYIGILWYINICEKIYFI